MCNDVDHVAIKSLATTSYHSNVLYAQLVKHLLFSYYEKNGYIVLSTHYVKATSVNNSKSLE